MSWHIYVVVVLGSLFAAAGQLMFKIGATGRETLTSFFNFWIVSGLLAYAVGTLLWIYSLSRAKLTLVYPFTALTFVLVYTFGVLILQEATTVKSLFGVAMILAGLFLICSS